MMINKLSDKIYIGKLEGENVDYYYNTLNPNGVILVDSKTSALLQECKGGESSTELAQKYGIDENELKGDLEALANLGLFEENNIDGNKKYSWKIKQYDAWFHVTNVCNLNCTYCYINKSCGDMCIELAKKYVDKIVDKCKEAECKSIYIRFAGGEPLLKVGLLKEVVDYCLTEYSEYIFKFCVITNGTIYSDEINDFLKKYRFSIGISVDGPEKYHNMTRPNYGGFNSFEKTMENIKRFLAGGNPVNILTTVSDINLDGLEELTEILTTMGVPFRYSMERNLTKAPKLSENPEKLINVLKNCIEIMKLKIKNGKSDFDFQINDLKFDKKVLRPCGAATSTFAANFDGKIGLCGMGLSKPLGTIEDGNPYDTVNIASNGLQDFTVDDIGECEGCMWKYSCASGCPLQNYYLYKTYKHCSPYCKVIKEVMPEYLELKAMLLYAKNK